MRRYVTRNVIHTNMPCKDYDNMSKKLLKTIPIDDKKPNNVATCNYCSAIGKNNRVKLAWLKLKHLTGVRCDKTKTRNIMQQRLTRQGVSELYRTSRSLTRGRESIK